MNWPLRRSTPTPTFPMTNGSLPSWGLPSERSWPRPKRRRGPSFDLRRLRCGGLGAGDVLSLRPCAACAAIGEPLASRLPVQAPEGVPGRSGLAQLVGAGDGAAPPLTGRDSLSLPRREGEPHRFEGMG